MASMRSRTAPIGSAKWVLDEREQAGQFIEQEVEEFAFSARNEFEWLNEHMAEIFSSSQFDVAEVFKTPGKLRGKTPRTARKHTPAQDRQPLTDIFSSNTPNAVGSPKNDFYKKLAPIQVAQDKENIAGDRSPQQQKQSPLRPLGANEQRAISPKKASTPPLPPKSPLRPASERKSPSPSRVTQLKQQHENRSTGDSFVSAKEAFSNRDESIHEPRHDRRDASPEAPPAIAAMAGADSAASPPKAVLPEGIHPRESHQYSVSTTTAAGMEHVLHEAEKQSAADDEDNDDANNGHDSPSENSSPERPFLRKKSSLTFASLPAREPLSKKSVGARVSHATTSEKNSNVRDSVAIQQSQTHSVAQTDKPVREEPMEQQTLNPQQATEDSEASKLHSKTSTQRLHERITMLGKTNPPSNTSRTSKSVSTSHAPQPTTQTAPDEALSQATEVVDNDEDWIAPMSQVRTTQSTQQSMPGSFSTMSSNLTALTQDTSLFDSQPVEPMADDKPASYPAQSMYPDLKSAPASSTTPAGSPMAVRWNMDGPLSASKAKFNSFLKSAKGMFASSAAASAQAKLESLSEHASKSTLHLPETRPAPEEQPSLKAVPMDDTDDELQQSSAKSLDRRRSSQRLKERSLREASATADPEAETEDVRMDDHPDQPDGDVEGDVEADVMDVDIDPTPASKKTQAQTTSKTQPKPKGLATQSGELRHPAKANKGNKITKPAPAGKSAVSIRVPSQKTAGNFSSSVHGSSDKPTPSTASNAKAPTLAKKGSNSSLKSGTSSGNAKSTAANNARLKALDAAAKSKEREEREKQRKADEKRERERKRAEAEEEKRKRAQEHKAAEQRREREEQEARANAQRQRREREEQDRLKAEKQQAEIQRKNELLRRQAEAAKAAKAAKTELVQPEMQQEQPRPASRAGENLGGSVRPHMNPAKPKRYFQPEDDERPTRPNTAQNGSKRRKTSEEGGGDAAQQNSRPAMAPPVRPSMNRKPEVPNRFTHGYMASAAASAPNGAAAMQNHKPGVSSSYASNQPKTPHNMGDLAKFSSAKIPFGENANPPATQQASSSKHPTGRPLQKTPGTAHKSSPQFPDGDNISLPEIATDSEDSDDDPDFVAPDWTQSPELRALLERQQLVDPMRVFGPVGPLALEDVFRGNKERQARFRARTSSANWSGPDRLTEDERRRDREARAALERDGGWTFRPDL